MNNRTLSSRCKAFTRQWGSKHNMQHDIMPKRTTVYSFHRNGVSTNARKVMLMQCRITPCPLLLPSWLSVLPMLHIDLCPCLSESSGPCHDSRAQRAGRGPTCEGGEADFDERATTGRVEERSAATRRHLAQEPAAPRDQCHPISFPQPL